MALYWQEKSTLLTNENERIDNPNEDCKGRWRTQDEKNALSHYKNKQWA